MITPEDLNFFRQITETKVDPSILSLYSHDETEDIKSIPGVVLFPESTEEVSSIMRYCFQRELPVTPVGARTGLSGGAIPTLGGVVLSTEKLNRILKIDEDNHQVITEPGVITQVLQEAVAEKGLYYPPDPASKGSGNPYPVFYDGSTWNALY